MSRNQIFDEGDDLSVVCTDPATPKSGDPVLFGKLGGVAQTDERADGTTSVSFEGVFELSVKGTNGANTAIAPGDTITYNTGNTPKLDVTVAGVKFGTALEAVASGATATIRVRLNGAV